VNGRHVEGFVLEGQDGFMLKIKCAFYTAWKRIRSLKIPLSKGKGARPPAAEDGPTVAAVMRWLARPENRRFAVLDVIALRDRYYEAIDREPEPPVDDIDDSAALTGEVPPPLAANADADADADAGGSAGAGPAGTATAAPADNEVAAVVAAALAEIEQLPADPAVPALAEGDLAAFAATVRRVGAAARNSGYGASIPRSRPI